MSLMLNEFCCGCFGFVSCNSTLRLGSLAVETHSAISVIKRSSMCVRKTGVSKETHTHFSAGVHFGQSNSLWHTNWPKSAMSSWSTTSPDHLDDRNGFPNETVVGLYHFAEKDPFISESWACIQPNWRWEHFSRVPRHYACLSLFRNQRFQHADCVYHIPRLK